MKSRPSLGFVRGVILLTAAAVGWDAAAGGAQPPAAPSLDEYQVKAAFVYNFAKFVEWPPGAFGSATEAFSICVLGRNPFGRMLEAMTAGASLNGHPFVVRQIAEAAEATSCKILFVSSSERLRYRAILTALKGSPVFSVGDTEGFTADGGVAELRLEEGKVRIELNTRVAKEEDLRISSRLMSLAHSQK
ncbi:MAG: YfiR family protein [Terriglobia bacterium]